LCLQFLRDFAAAAPPPTVNPDRPPIVPLPDNRPSPPSPLARLCLAILNSNEFLYLD